ncbi:MAG: Ycf66 family protein [Spirulinaceae cyanobacterium]
MLVYTLAIAVALGSFTFYMAAFFFPEVHRRNDFIWSGVGLFYALVLWLCADRITGGVLLGQSASIALLGWLGWQTLTLRRTKAPTEAKTEVSDATTAQTKKKLLGGITGLFRKQKPEPNREAKPESVAELVDQEAATETATPEHPSVTETEAEMPETPAASATETPSEADAEIPETPETGIPDAVMPPPEAATPPIPKEVIPDDTSEDDSNWPDDEEETETPPHPDVAVTATPPAVPSAASQEDAQTAPEAPEIEVEKVAPEAELTPPAEDPTSHDAPNPTEPINSEEPPKV